MNIGSFRLPRAAAALALSALAGACKLTEVTTAPGEDVIVVEAVLRTDAERQSILLHRSVQGEVAGGVPGATVTLTDDRGERRVLTPSAACYTVDGAYVESDSLQVQGTCYAEPAGSLPPPIRPGATYDLEIRTPDGKVIRGRTHVPGAFAAPTLPAPRADGTRICSIPPNTAYTLLWRQSAGAWSYVGDLSIRGLPTALKGGGAIPDPLELRGFSISASDTTLVLPTDFGVFDRFTIDSELLLLIRDGLPEGTRAVLVLAAADRNWVNSVRGGSFNPSGQIRISSVTGDGVGVFGSLTAYRVGLFILEKTSVPRCPGLQ